MVSCHMTNLVTSLGKALGIPFIFLRQSYYNLSLGLSKFFLQPNKMRKMLRFITESSLEGSHIIIFKHCAQFYIKLRLFYVQKHVQMHTRLER